MKGFCNALSKEASPSRSALQRSGNLRNQSRLTSSRQPQQQHKHRSYKIPIGTRLCCSNLKTLNDSNTDNPLEVKMTATPYERWKPKHYEAPLAKSENNCSLRKNLTKSIKSSNKIGSTNESSSTAINPDATLPCETAHAGYYLQHQKQDLLLNPELQPEHQYDQQSSSSLQHQHHYHQRTNPAGDNYNFGNRLPKTTTISHVTVSPFKHQEDFYSQKTTTNKIQVISLTKSTLNSSKTSKLSSLNSLNSNTTHQEQQQHQHQQQLEQQLCPELCHDYPNYTHLQQPHLTTLWSRFLKTITAIVNVTANVKANSNTWSTAVPTTNQSSYTSIYSSSSSPSSALASETSTAKPTKSSSSASVSASSSSTATSCCCFTTLFVMFLILVMYSCPTTYAIRLAGGMSKSTSPNKEQLYIGLIAPHTNFGKREYLRAIHTAVGGLNKTRGAKLTFFQNYQFEPRNIRFDMMSLTPSPTGKCEHSSPLEMTEFVCLYVS